MKRSVNSKGMAVLVGVACMGAALLGGCGTSVKQVDYARPFPGMRQSEVIDVQVFLRPRSVEFTNTSARAFGACTMWLNGRYCAPIDSIAVGQTIKIPLDRFRDENGETLRPGGFWAIEKPDRLAKAQLELPQEDGTTRLIGLIVVRNEQW